MSAANGLIIGSPGLVSVTANTPTNSTFQIDASTKGVSFIVQAPSASAITHLGFRYGARTGTPPTYRISLQTPTAAGGVPDGTVLGGASPASATVTPPASTAWDGTWQWVALSNSYTPTRGQLLCVVIEHSSGTVDASNRSSFTTDISGWGQDRNVFPYYATETTSTWSKASSTVPPYGLRGASERTGWPIQGTYTTNTAATNGLRQAMTFTLPAGHGDTFRVSGVTGMFQTAAAAGNTFKIALWDGSSELQAITFDSDIISSSPASPRLGTFMFSNSSLATLTYGTKYYIGIEVTSSSGVGLRGWQLADSADAVAFPGGSVYGFATYNGTTWTDDNTVRPLCALILDDITEPAASGSGYVIGG